MYQWINEWVDNEQIVKLMDKHIDKWRERERLF